MVLLSEKKTHILKKPSDLGKHIEFDKRHIVENVMDVVLSPSLRNEEVIQCFISKLETFS